MRRDKVIEGKGAWSPEHHEPQQRHPIKMVGELLVAQLEKGGGQQQRKGGDARCETERKQHWTHKLDARADRGSRRRVEPWDRMLVRVEEDRDIPVRCLEYARDEKNLREPESNDQVEQRAEAALDERDNIVPRLEQRRQARCVSDSGAAGHRLLLCSAKGRRAMNNDRGRKERREIRSR